MSDQRPRVDRQLTAGLAVVGFGALCAVAGAWLTADTSALPVDHPTGNVVKAEEPDFCVQRSIASERACGELRLPPGTHVPEVGDCVMYSTRVRHFVDIRVSDDSIERALWLGEFGTTPGNGLP